MKIISFGSFRRSAKSMFKQLKILNVENMCKRKLAKIMHECNNGQIPIKIEQLYLQRHRKYTNITPDKQLMMFTSYQKFICNLAKNHYHTEAVNCETVITQK